MTQAGLKEDNANKQGRMEEEANQLYRRPQMTGQARDEEKEDEEEEEEEVCRLMKVHDRAM